MKICSTPHKKTPPHRFLSQRNGVLSSLSEKPCYYAAIDLGTTSCRLLIVKNFRGKFKIIERFSSPVLLGEGVSLTGKLDEQAIERTLETLRLFARKMAHWPISSIYAITTEVCRQAENSQEFLERVYAETGLKIQIISDREEAELALESCRSLLCASPAGNQPGRALIFDIGGGSTELSWVRTDSLSQRHYLAGMTSLKQGIVSLTELFAHLAPKDAYHAAFKFIRGKLEQFEKIYCIKREVARHNVQLIGLSGTITTIAGVALDLKRYDRYRIDGTVLSSETVAQAVAKIKTMSRSALEKHPCIGYGRSSLVLAGCAIYEAIQSMWPIDYITIADRGLRDGMVMRMARNHKLRFRQEYNPKSDSSMILRSGALALSL
ncbi:Ppx/GppA phosphatase family protein [Acetobacteraceae bacterium ESL0709]|nr:Ppx/GppA phosphatase family protein [Acetobacteraceae bacterium ESL0697]MDF7677893.1 Ppx/GppA phosphatase family protein [Acetobacteraceae bacterium ESL0709]